MKRLREIPEPSAELDAARNRLFKHFGLDPREPEHWPLVVDCVAFAEFRGKPGRPKVSSPIADVYIAARIARETARAKKEGRRPMSDVALAHVMQKSATYSHLGGVRTIRAHIARVKKSVRTGK